MERKVWILLIKIISINHKIRNYYFLIFRLHFFKKDLFEFVFSTFDENNNYIPNHSKPIEEGVLIHLKNKRIQNTFLKSK